MRVDEEPFAFEVMRAIIHPGTYSLTATQVVRLLEGMKTTAVAAPAPNGDPLVAPMDGWFLQRRFYFSSGGDAVRIRGLRRRPRASIACRWPELSDKVAGRSHSFSGHLFGCVAFRSHEAMEPRNEEAARGRSARGGAGGVLVASGASDARVDAYTRADAIARPDAVADTDSVAEPGATGAVGARARR